MATVLARRLDAQGPQRQIPRALPRSYIGWAPMGSGRILKLTSAGRSEVRQSGFSSLACRCIGITYVSRPVGCHKVARTVVAALIIMVVICGRRFMRVLRTPVEVSVVAVNDRGDRRPRRHAAR